MKYTIIKHLILGLIINLEHIICTKMNRKYNLLSFATNKFKCLLFYLSVIREQFSFQLYNLCSKITIHFLKVKLYSIRKYFHDGEKVCRE